MNHKNTNPHEAHTYVAAASGLRSEFHQLVTNSAAKNCFLVVNDVLALAESPALFWSGDGAEQRHVDGEGASVDYSQCVEHKRLH